ncbi:hypothetical protein M231_04381 [Tremella mesenterica]|uniref:Secreted protein n=1 Tax=Tremella mesenterica TaxID=5217 RepID=A0A4Q1BKQ8_TREME|nr:hypothetical protein M231_04381 [Tremella mesenterica]
MLSTKLLFLLAIQTLVSASYYQVNNVIAPLTIKAGEEFSATLVIEEINYFTLPLSVAWGLSDSTTQSGYNPGILLEVDTLFHKLHQGVREVDYNLTAPTELFGPYTLIAFVTCEQDYEHQVSINQFAWDLTIE